MKKINYLFFAVISILSAKAFTVSDPPMLYIYHFVSYDTTSILLHGGDQDESKSKILQFPLFNKNDISSGENLVLGKPLDPKLVSAIPFTPATGRKLLVRTSDDFINVQKKLINEALKKMRKRRCSSLHFLFIEKDEISIFEKSRQINLPPGFRTL